jgi:urease accessory protein
MMMTCRGFGILVIAIATPALAHTGVAAPSGFAAGLFHPLLGLDHVLAMAAVGFWAGLVGGRAIWAWPLAFLGLMAGGAWLGLSGMTMQGIEAGIALSVLALGSAVAARLPLGVGAGAAVCGVFALFHGHAHGTELPDRASAATYVLGFMLATVLLHVLGVALGRATPGSSRAWWPRLAGSAIAVAGAVFLMA